MSDDPEPVEGSVPKSRREQVGWPKDHLSIHSFRIYLTSLFELGYILGSRKAARFSSRTSFSTSTIQNPKSGRKVKIRGARLPLLSRKQRIKGVTRMPPNLRIFWFDLAVLNSHDFHIISYSVALLEFGFSFG